MTNTTGLNTSDTGSPNTCTLYYTHAFVGYIILGFIAFVANVWMGGTILARKQLRTKELLVVCGLCLGDMVFGLGNFITGCRRLHLACQGRLSELVSVGFCQKELHPILLLGGSQLSSVMMFVLSIDRLMAVVTFTSYMTLTTKYSLTVVMSAVIYTIISVMGGTIDAAVNADDTPQYPVLCNAPHAANPTYGRYFLYFNAACSVSSIVVYIVVVIANFARFYTPAGAAATGNHNQVHMKTQRRLTITLGIVSLCTLFLHTIPFTVLVFGTYVGSILKTLGPYMGMFFCLNACVNIFIFGWRHTMMRAFMLCRNPNNVVHVATYYHAGQPGQASTKEHD